MILYDVVTELPISREYEAMKIKLVVKEISTNNTPKVVNKNFSSAKYLILEDELKYHLIMSQIESNELTIGFCLSPQRTTENNKQAKQMNAKILMAH